MKRHANIGDKIVLNGEILKTRKYSNHPGDQHLEVVLVELPQELPQEEHFVTWVHNTESGGFFWGHYNRSRKAAEIDFEMRNGGGEVAWK